jgi:TonB-dependent starch-binding outer membrane protein SusC
LPNFSNLTKRKFMSKRLHIQKALQKIMRISLYQAILALCFVGLTQAHEVTAQKVLEQRVTIQLSNLGVVQILDKIEKVTDVKFMYNPQIFPAGQRFNLKFEDEPLYNVLNTLLTPVQVAYEVVNRRIILKRDNSQSSLDSAPSLEAEVIAPKRLVRGTVVDERNAPLPGVSVVVKNTQRGSSTDANGAFEVDVPNDQAVLVFSFVGYLKQEITVGSQSTISIQMKPDENALDEVVVVGYGTVEKSDLTGAVGSIQTRDIVRANPVMASKALQGQVAGLTVTRQNNRPGVGYSITIRGENTINNSTEPLVVIDGLMGGDINTLNPNDIQSMDVLKDASSTAIYGSRGANGVIIITTKKGLSGKPRVSYDSYVGEADDQRAVLQGYLYGSSAGRPHRGYLYGRRNG